MNSEHDITFADNDVMRQYKAIPEDLCDYLEAQYDVLLSATSMRKAPFPAHRNRGVSIRVEDPALSVTVHAVRSQGTVEILGLILKRREGFQQEDYETEQSVDCVFCGAKAGSRCLNTDGRQLTYAGDRRRRRRTHYARRELYLTGVVTRRGKNPMKQAAPLSSEYIGTELLEARRGDDWDKLIADFRHMYSSPEVADGLITGAMKVVERHQPGRIWGRGEFWAFVCTNVSGPHTEPEKFINRLMATAYKSGQISQMQLDEFRRYGLKSYAEFIGLDFAPHPMGGLVAVRGLKEI